MAKPRKQKKPIIPEDRPQFLEAEDFEMVRDTYTIHRYQLDALGRQHKKTGRGKAEIVRMALDALLFKARRHTDIKPGEARDKN